MRRLAILLGLTVVVAGCATAPIFRKQSFDFKSTALFRQPCDSPEVLEAKREIPDDGLETKDNQCNSVHLLRMVDRFMSIQEADEPNGVPGDTMADVRAKGFSIFIDAEGRKRRPNTKPLYGNDALASVGMSVAPPPLQRPQSVVDRICLNRRDSAELGDDRTFAIVWRGVPSTSSWTPSRALEPRPRPVCP